MTKILAIAAALLLASGADAQEKASDFGGAEPIHPERWIHPDDYPGGLVTRGAGIVFFGFDITAQGVAENCHVTKSSGNPVFDETTCRLFVEHARFKPRLDAEGEPIATSGHTRMRWNR